METKKNMKMIVEKRMKTRDEASDDPFAFLRSFCTASDLYIGNTDGPPLALLELIKVC